MAGMAVDPHQVVRDVTRRAHDVGAGQPPSLLRRPPGASAPLPPVQHGEELAAVHRAWAEADAHHGGPIPAAGGRRLGAVWARVRAGVAAATASAPPDHGTDRAVVGDLIRAVDALARRVDELGGRLAALDELVEEVVVVTGEDLARVRAALAGAEAPRADPSRDRGPTADG